MAGIVNREWTVNVNVKKGSNNESGVKVVIWDADSATPVTNLTTDANGNIAEQELQEAVYSITGTNTVATDDKTPHVFSIVKYGLEPLGLNVSILGQRTDTFFVTDNLNITESTKATVAAYTGITINHTTDTITLTQNRTIRELYDYCQNEAFDDPQKDFPGGIMTTVDGQSYILEYDLVIDSGCVFDGENRTLNMATGKDITVTGSGTIDLNPFTIGGDLNWQSSDVTIEDITVTGTLDLDTATTYTFDSMTVDTLTNSSGGSITVNAVSSTITTNTGPNITINNSVNITITVIDSANNPIQDARVFVAAAAGGSETPGTELLLALTNASGIATTTFNYSADQPISGRARKSTSAPFYKQGIITGTILSSGFATTLILQLDQ